MRYFNDYKPEFIGFLIGLASLNLWYISSLAIEESLMPKNYHYALTAFISLVGAFVGAYSAFKLRQYEDKKSQVDNRIFALNAALFILARQIQANSGFKKEFDKYKTEFERTIVSTPIIPADYSDLTHNFDNLSFIVSEGEPQLLLNLFSEQKRFEQTVSSILIRNEFYFKTLQPALEEHDLIEIPAPQSQYVRKLGLVYKGAVHNAKPMYDLVYSSDKSLLKVFLELREFSKKLFPESEFLAIENNV